MACIVKNCKNVHRFLPLESKITFHRFPKNTLRYHEWLLALGIDVDTPHNRTMLVCSQHFKEEDFKTVNKPRKLNPNATPKLKDFPHEIPMQVCTQKVQPQPSSAFRTSGFVVSDEKSPKKSKETEHRAPASKKIRLESITPNPSPASGSGSVSDEIMRLTEERISSLIIDKSKKRIKTGRPSSSTGGSSSSSKRRLKRIRIEHQYATTPMTLLKKYKHMTNTLKFQSAKLYKTQARLTTIKRKVSSLKEIVRDLQKKDLMSSNATDHLDHIGRIPSALVRRLISNANSGSVSRSSYPEEIKKFAFTLHFYSPKAYNYVRKVFHLALPNPSTLRAWKSGLNFEPGFSSLCFDLLEKKTDMGRIICSLMLDEMSIKKLIEYDGNKFWGYTDIGHNAKDDVAEPATEVLVVMAVAVNGHWKLPIGYFLTCGLNATEKAQIVKEALIRLAERKICITSVTCDGPATHFTMFNKLGCDFSDIHRLKVSFKHPSIEEKDVFAIFDTCHMLKLLRNCFASSKILVDQDGNLIQWEYLTKLFHLQQQEGLHFANKLSKKHIENWFRLKMKVNIAAQTLSNSVAEALLFLAEDLKLEEFAGCRPTAEFLKVIDTTFNVTNSRTPFASESKCPLRLSNQDFWRPWIKYATRYLTQLTNVKGEFLWRTKQRTPIYGFVVSLSSLQRIFDYYVKDTQMLNYLLTYKFSQDHLELFFCAIRTRNGWNNNPSALQFMRSYKDLLIHADIRGNSGNCEVLDATSILSIISSNKNKIDIDVADLRKNSIEVAEVVNEPDDEFVELFTLNEISECIVVYLSGYVVKMLYKILHCNDCTDLLTSKSDNLPNNYTFLLRRNLGPYYIPSLSVYTICKETEKFIRCIMNLNNNKMPNNLQSDAVTYVSRKLLFKNLFNSHVEHYLLLTKNIVKCYSKIRLNHLAKQFSSAVRSQIIRQQYTKLIIFNHQ